MPLPNILFIQSDQHRWDCLGVSGHPIVQTPHLDRLAAQGANFVHAFCPIPVCIPARNSLHFGVWPSRHLVIANSSTEAPRPAADGLLSFSEALRGGGYDLVCVGKWEVHPHKTPQDYGYQEWIDNALYHGWREVRGLPPRPRRSRWFGELDPGVTPDETRLGWGASQVIARLEACAARGGLFFLRWDTAEPHLPNVVPEPYYSLYPPEMIPPWPSFPDPLAGKPYIQAQQRRTWRLDGWTWADWQPIVSRCLGEISLLDAQVGRVLAALDRLGLAENTLVVYSSDHGDLCGGHGMIDKHYVLYDDVVRVPLLARWPGVIAPGTRCDSFVSSGPDLAATFCDAAGVAIPETFQGASLLPLLAGGAGRADIFAMYHGGQFGLYSQRMVRDARWKYVWNATAEDELYDLVADPGEVHNRAADPHCAGELKRLRARLVEWMEQTGDRLLNEWTRAQLLEGLKG